MFKYNNIDLLKSAVEKAHTICNKLSLQEAIKMKESEVRDFLNSNKVTEQEMQDTYLNILRLYEFMNEDCKQHPGGK